MKYFIALFLTFSALTFAEKVLVIDVEGMTCKLCPIAVKKAISKVQGVKWVVTTLENRIAVVVTGDEVTPETVLKAISSAGNYRGKLIGEGKF